MKFLGSNVKYDDCMVVALYNAILATGTEIEYDVVYNTCLEKGWYQPGITFQCKFLDEAFAHFGLVANLLPDPKETRKIYKQIVDQQKVFFFFRPSEYSCIPGHAMVAKKGQIGVEVLNPYHEQGGWRTMSKEIRSGAPHFAIEVKKAA